LEVGALGVSSSEVDSSVVGFVVVGFVEFGIVGFVDRVDALEEVVGASDDVGVGLRRAHGIVPRPNGM
jgi:hypothetical protein